MVRMRWRLKASVGPLTPAPGNGSPGRRRTIARPFPGIRRMRRAQKRVQGGAPHIVRQAIVFWGTESRSNPSSKRPNPAGNVGRPPHRTSGPPFRPHSSTSLSLPGTGPPHAPKDGSLPTMSRRPSGCRPSRPCASTIATVRRRRRAVPMLLTSRWRAAVVPLTCSRAAPVKCRTCAMSVPVTWRASVTAHKTHRDEPLPYQMRNDYKHAHTQD